MPANAPNESTTSPYFISGTFITRLAFPQEFHEGIRGTRARNLGVGCVVESLATAISAA
jgi:hypothetical protein